MKKIISSILSVIIFSMPVIAQESDSGAILTPGDRVRVTAPLFFRELGMSKPSRQRPHVVGTLTAVKADTLLIKIGKRLGPLAIPVFHIKKIEVSQGKKTWKAKGALIGSAVGFVIAEALCANTRYEDSGTMGIDRWVCGSLLGAPGGAAIGFTMGAVIKRDRWEEVELNEALKDKQN